MEGYKELCRLHLEKQNGFPYPVKYKHKPDSANGLTRCIRDYMKLIGATSPRINTGGIWVQPKAKEGIKQKGYFRKSGATKGVSDIIVFYKMKPFCIEVKWKKDKQNENQKKFQADLKNNAVYYIARDFESFYQWFNQFIEDVVQEPYMRPN